MTLKFSPHPGPHERHLRRRYGNPLFSAALQEVSETQLQDAREADEKELNHFLRYFRDLVQEAIDLKPDAQSETILDLKERLDRCYAHCCALPGEKSEIQAAINKLIEVIMKAVRQGAANDPLALDKLAEENIARQMHNELHQFSLVADLMLPDSPISKEELIPSLLTEAEAGLSATLQLFEPDQLTHIYQQAKIYIQQLPVDVVDQTEVDEKIKLIEARLNMSTIALSS